MTIPGDLSSQGLVCGRFTGSTFVMESGEAMAQAIDDPALEWTFLTRHFPCSSAQPFASFLYIESSSISFFSTWISHHLNITAWVRKVISQSSSSSSTVKNSTSVLPCFLLKILTLLLAYVCVFVLDLKDRTSKLLDWVWWLRAPQGSATPMAV